tara:strand:- start:503 stop:619 length:117 start_codon:yes stop_codon:yes gene_type:complete
MMALNGLHLGQNDGTEYIWPIEKKKILHALANPSQVPA